MAEKTNACGCCGRGPDRARLRAPLSGWRDMFGLPECICSDCLMVWHDGGETDPEEIKRTVLEKEQAHA